MKRPMKIALWIALLPTGICYLLAIILASNYFDRFEVSILLAVFSSIYLLCVGLLIWGEAMLNPNFTTEWMGARR